jgi:hypothetical protein
MYVFQVYSQLLGCQLNILCPCCVDPYYMFGFAPIANAKEIKRRFEVECDPMTTLDNRSNATCQHRTAMTIIMRVTHLILSSSSAKIEIKA